MAGNPKFHALLKKMADMHDKKSADYATSDNYYSNFETAATVAGTTVDVVFRVLIGVKLARLIELQGKGKVPKNEAVEDSLLDLAVYSTLYASYYEPVPKFTSDPTWKEQLAKIAKEAVEAGKEIKNMNYRDRVIGEHHED